jgi:FkbM family methyltransferase
MNVIDLIKKTLKNGFATFSQNLFKHRKHFRFLRYYPRSRNYVFDIINFKQDNNLPVIFDVGANLGQSAKYYRKLFSGAHIHCFEPIDATFQNLSQNLSKDKGIQMHHCALGSKSESIDVFFKANSGENSLLPDVNEKYSGESRQTVLVKRLDDVAKELKINHIDLLKIDTEGFDFEVLKGAENMLNENRIDFILCEIGFFYEKKHGNFEEINRYLFDKRYRLVGIYDNYYWGTRFILHGFANALYIRQDIAFS